MASSLPSELVQAYLQARYEVWLPAPDQSRGCACVLQVDVAQPQLLQAMRMLKVHHACLLTACNPLGKLLPPQDNAQRMQALRQTLQSAGWTWATALGGDPFGQWPGEDSLLVWHMDRIQARHWGLQWAQNAVLVVGDDATPRLECLR